MKATSNNDATDGRKSTNSTEDKSDDDSIDSRSDLGSKLTLSDSSIIPNTRKNNDHIGDVKNDFESNLAKQGTRQVDILRYTVIAILMLSAFGVSVVVFFLTKRAQQQQFDAQYYGAAAKITTSIGTVIDKIDMINAVGMAATIQGMNEDLNTTYWPFVTLPSFEQRVASAKASSGALLMSLMPIVSENDRDEWEFYSVEKGTTWM
jgi:hypothetical protein